MVDKLTFYAKILTIFGKELVDTFALEKLWIFFLPEFVMNFLNFNKNQSKLIFTKILSNKIF